MSNGKVPGGSLRFSGAGISPMTRKLVKILLWARWSSFQWLHKTGARLESTNSAGTLKDPRKIPNQRIFSILYLVLFFNNKADFMYFETFKVTGSIPNN